MVGGSLLARLIAAHIIGDFVLQPDSWVAGRNARHFRSPHLYGHALVHFILAWSFSLDAQGWQLAIVIAAGHLLFDGLKALSGKQGLAAFVTDQAAHGLLLLAAWSRFTGFPAGDWLAAQAENARLWWTACGYLLIIFLFPRLISIATRVWRKDIPPERELLYKAGRWIGIIERILVLTFVLLHQFAAIGFLMAAKSVFRFGDLKEGRDKGHTEYVLIGTLLSFGLTIITGLVLQRLIQH